MAKNINCIAILITLEGIKKIKTGKKKKMTTESVNKHLNGFSIFIGCLTSYTFLSLF